MSVGLEPWTEADLPLVQALIGDPVMMEHLGGPEAPEKIVERHGRYVGAPGVFNVTFEGVPAGWVGYWRLRPEQRLVLRPQCEITRRIALSRSARADTALPL